MTDHDSRLYFKPADLEVYTAYEACEFLRLADGRSEDAAIAALNRLVDRGLIRPAMYGKRRMYSRQELTRFVADQTAAYGDAGGAA